MHGDPARTQKPDPFRIMAISISMAIHVGFAWNVLNSPNEVRHDARPEGDSIMHVSFITAKLPPSEPKPSVPSVRTRAGGINPEVRDVPDLQTTSVGHVGASPANEKGLNLRPPDLPVDFSRGIATRTGPSMEASMIKSRFEIRDRSFGGRLLSISKARYCGELRSALARHPESTTAILDSMKDYQCQT